MTLPTTAPHWSQLLEAWDQQQSGYLLRREERFAVVLDVLTDPLIRALPGDRPTRILDLGCGPGSFAARILDRLPQAHVVALDMDPVLLAVGAGALGDADGRLTWVDADLRNPGWDSLLDAGSFDAVVSSTALQWLSPSQLASVYHRVARLTFKGGCFFNADNMAYDTGQLTFNQLAASAVAAHSSAAFSNAETSDWDAWWDTVEDVRELVVSGSGDARSVPTTRMITFLRRPSPANGCTSPRCSRPASPR